ncbi:MAG: multidrug efflux SMR transporter [Chitinophagaceae bacterium]|jgi:small multidrug resistance pump|uniref:DMT family transporter n=1 Tax=unclassified Paraflavitalea TaxID=2798305 RepID=UPI003D32ED7D|nr:multidrug efflux SMR transporter [Chitinophagaceae bacterium]
MAYLLLALTILVESAAVIFMKLSNGFQHKPFAVAAIGSYILSFVLLTFALKTLPVGIANAIWAGASTFLVALVGVFFLKEQLSTIHWVSLIFIGLGIVGLHWPAHN